MNTASTPTQPTQTSAEIVRAFVDEYFKAWQGTNVNKILISADD